MNRIRNILLVILLSFCSVAHSQTVTLGIQTGIGFYNMKELKGFNSIVFKNLNFTAKNISNYPSYFYYKPSLILPFDKFRVGFQISYCSTGSRISSKDYSGEYLFNTKINCYAPSICFSYSLFSLFKTCKVSLFSEAGILFSKLDLKEILKVNDQDITNSSYIFTSRNYYIEPGLKFEHKLYRFINIELNTSYSAQFGKNDFETDKKEMLNYGGEAVGPDWSGLRFGLSILVTPPLKNF